MFPYVVVSPAYFAGAIQLGGLMQTASAFNSVQTALSFFITVYRQMAEWRAVIQRLAGLQLERDRGPRRRRSPPVIAVEPRAGRRPSQIDDVAVACRAAGRSSLGAGLPFPPAIAC